jgi:hypothetical protein
MEHIHHRGNHFYYDIFLVVYNLDTRNHLQDCKIFQKDSHFFWYILDRAVKVLLRQ